MIRLARTRLRPRYVIALLAVASGLILLSPHPRAVSSTSSFSASERVTVNATGEQGTVVAAPDGSHVVVALDGARTNVQSFLPDQISPMTTTPLPFPTRTALSLGSFDQAYALDGGISEAGGVFTVSYSGGGVNGYARGLFDYDSPQILEGQQLWFGARFFLPVGFSSSAGYVSLMRRDNYGLYGSAGNTCGVALWSGDNRLHAECNTYDGSWPTQDLIGGVVAPEGRWFTLELHQTLDSAAGGVTELYLDGAKVGSSTGINNLLNRATDRVRFGVVAVGPQAGGFSLQFAGAYVSNVRQPLR
jgi:hypothetical protein